MEPGRDRRRPLRPSAAGLAAGDRRASAPRWGSELLARRRRSGRFGVTDKLTGLNPAAYGCCILALSAHQTHLPRGWPGGDRIAIHGGGGIGAATSNGCLHATAAVLRRLMRRVPLGTAGRGPPVTEQASAPAGRLGGLTRRSGPEAGLRPTVLFALAGSLTVAWVAFAVWASDSVARRARGCSRPRDGLGDPDPARLHPRPGDRVHALHAAGQPVPRAGARCARRAVAGRPVAGGDRRDRGPERGRRDRAHARADRRARPTQGRSRSCWPTTTRPTAPARSGTRRRSASGSTTGGSSSRSPASTRRSTRRSQTVTTPIVVTVDADTLLHARVADATSSLA